MQAEAYLPPPFALCKSTLFFLTLPQHLASWHLGGTTTLSLNTGSEYASNTSKCSAHDCRTTAVGFELIHYSSHSLTMLPLDPPRQRKIEVSKI
jgi:hypothetical protein